jgi:hypothetical protein
MPASPPRSSSSASWRRRKRRAMTSGARCLHRTRLGVEAAIGLDDHRARCADWATRPTGTMPTAKASEAATSPWIASMLRAVLEVFVQLYEQGLIYRGKRLVNWDPVLRHRGVRPRGGAARRKTAASGRSAIRWPTAAGRPGGRHHAARDHAGRHRGGGASRRTSATRTLIGKQRAAAADRPRDPGHRRRLCRSRTSAPAA